MAIDILPPDAGEAVLSDYRLSQDVGETLLRHYPGYAWLVRVNSDSGVCLIQCAQVNSVILGHRTPSMVVHLSNMTDPSIYRKRVVYLAGELLERAGLTRGKWRGEIPKKVEGLEKWKIKTE
jgi:hypothetical protein